MKNGFTLIEMIGVMVILSLLMAFAMPNIINYIKKGGDTKDTVVKTLVYDAASKYIDDNKKIFKQDKKNIYCISVYTLAKGGYVESPIVLSGSNEDITSETSTKSVKVTYDKKYKYELTDECTGIVNPTPVLTKGLTPVVYDEENENWVVVDPKDNNWYNYDEQKWANAVVLGTDVTKQVGDTVAVDGSEAKMMLVWIPRYEYNYKNLEEELTEDQKSTPPEIEVNFVLKNAKNGSTSKYKVHPAFTFGEREVSGFWVGKFELSSISTNLNDINNLGCNDEGCISDISNLRVLPNAVSIKNNSISNFWYAIRNIEKTSLFGVSNMDTHMIKNSEWGAIAYLSQSKYGKYGNKYYEGEQREVYQNKSDAFITGSSNGTPSQDTSYTQCTYNQKKGIDTNQDQNNCGPGASTTGNIYGVYDMSGGTSEYVMGVYGINNPTTQYSGFNINLFTDGNIKSKYYDLYATQISTSACNNSICFGHALSETSQWYNDTFYMPFNRIPWIIRGGSNDYGTNNNSGIFYSNGNGGLNTTSSTRFVSMNN